MAAWADDDMRWSDEAVDRAENNVTDHLAYDGVAGYPEWTQDECSAAELVAAIADLERALAKGADETAELRRLIA